MRIIPRRALAVAPAVAWAAAARPLGAQQADITRLLVAFPPGAALDGVARLLAAAAPRAGIGTVVVENRPGAGGNIAAAAAARARPDGRTLLLTIDTTLTVNPHIYPDPGFDAGRDLEPVATCATFPVVLLAHPGSGIAGLDGLAEEALRRPPLLYGSGGSGTPGHLAMEQLRAALGLPPGAMEHVAFRGNPQVLAELVAGRVRAGFVAIGGGGAEFVRDGRLRAIAVSGPHRIAVLPEVPTVAELGRRGFDVRFAFVLMAPRGTPAEAKRAWAGLAAETLSTPEARTRLDAWGGLEPPEAGGLEGTAAWIERAHARWGQVARDAGMRPD